MYTVSREFAFCYGHRLLEYAGKCAHLHGHNATVRITLRSERLDESGMVLDFTELKRTIGLWIETELDHRMLLCERDPLLPLLREAGEPVVVLPFNPTAENLARLIFEKVREFKLPVTETALWETGKCCAVFSRDL